MSAPDPLPGLIETRTDYREKDVLDKQVLTRVTRDLAGESSG